MDTATFDLNGKSQTPDALDGEVSPTLNVNNGTLILSNGGISSGLLIGAGQLNVNGGTLNVQGANSGLIASTVIVLLSLQMAF